MSLCAILKTFGWKTVLSISNQLFTEDSLMIHFYDFEQRIMFKGLKIILTNKFKNYLNEQHETMKFTLHIEETVSLSILDITINRQNNKFVTSVYRKPTFSSVFTNFESFIPEMHKRGLICFIEVLDYALDTKTFVGKFKL